MGALDAIEKKARIFKGLAVQTKNRHGVMTKSLFRNQWKKATPKRAQWSTFAMLEAWPERAGRNERHEVIEHAEARQKSRVRKLRFEAARKGQIQITLKVTE